MEEPIATVLSWFWHLLAGVASLLFLLTALGGALGVLSALIGTIRRRCPWYEILIYTIVAAIGWGVLEAIFWLLDEYGQTDSVSTAIYWLSAALCAIASSFMAVPSVISEIWRSTQMNLTSFKASESLEVRMRSRNPLS